MVVICVAPTLVGGGVAACLRSRRETVTCGYVSKVAVIEMHGNVSGQTSNVSVTLESRQLQS